MLKLLCTIFNNSVNIVLQILDLPCWRLLRNTTFHQYNATLLSYFTFSHLADAFIQSDLHMCDLQCIHILHFTFTLMAHCTSGAIRGSVSCSRTLRQGIELATF